MLLIPCPWCGQRDESEFLPGGDAGRPFPDLSADAAAWQRFVHLRDNPKGRHVEFWYHAQGCERWLKVTRDTRSHGIAGALDAEKEAS